MVAIRPITTRAIVAGLGLGLVPVAVAYRVMPSETELPAVEVLQPLDLPIAAAAVCVWLLAAVVLRPPRIPAKLALAFALLLATLPVFVSQSLLPTPVSNDERAYLLQAEMFAAGHISLPLVEPSEMLRRRQIHEDPVRGIIYAKYPPGTAAALAPGTLVGLPSAMVVIAGCLSVLLTAAIARRLGLADPTAAALLFASCPLFLLLQASYQSQVFTMPAVLAGYLALLNARADPERAFAWGAALGVSAGWVFSTRPLSGLVFGLAMLPGLLNSNHDRRAPGPRAILGAVLGGLPFVATLLFYNHTLTGNALLTPYALYAAEFSPWDVYPLFRAQHFSDPSLAVLQNLFRQFVRWLPAIFGMLGAVSLGYWGLWRFRGRDGGAGLAFALGLPFAYALHWYPGHWAALGPIYAAESLGLLVLAAVGLLERAPAGWFRSLPPIALAAGLTLFVYRFALIEDHSLRRVAPQTAVAEAPPPIDAVVLLPRFHKAEKRERSMNRYTPSRPPFGEGVVYLRQLDSPARTRAALEALGLSGRAVYRFVPDESGFSGRLDPVDL
jgi:hypothetical protein